MLEPFAFDYAQMVFVATLGVVQFVAARNELYGLLFFRKQLIFTQFLSGILVLGAYGWFFYLGEPRNLPDTGPGLEANTQTIVFATASALAIALTFLSSSIVNYQWGSSYARNQRKPNAGIAVFKETTFYWATIKVFESYRR